MLLSGRRAALSASFTDTHVIVKESLENGLTLITESVPGVRSVAVGVWLKRGSRHEPAEQNGISHFIEHMVFKGTKGRSAERIAEEVDSIGGYMDAFTAKEYASFHLRVLDEHLPMAVDLLGDIVANPLFDPKEMVRERKVIFEEINMVEDTPDDLVMEIFAGSFWPGHPLGRSILGSKRTLTGLRRESLAAFFERVYQPRNIVIAAAGHLDHGATSALVRRHFGALRGRRSPVNGRPPRIATRVVTRSKRELEQVHVCLGARCYPQTHPDRYGCSILNTVLGGSMSSRLFQNVRERRGLAYSISSGVTAYSDSGLLSVYAGTSRESAREVIRLTLEEIRRLCGEKLGEVELRRAKDHLKGSLVLGLEHPAARMGQRAREEIYFARSFTLDELLAAVEAVTAEDVQRIASDLFRGGLGVSVLGDLRGWRPRERDLAV
jgi:predicted Zn-dependent peptidase